MMHIRLKQRYQSFVLAAFFVSWHIWAPPTRASDPNIAPSDADDVNKGYYLLQGVGAYNISAYGAISTAAEADSIARVLKEHAVSGIEYGPIYFHSQDIAACITVANVFRNAGIDLWLASADLQNDMRAFNNDAFPQQYRARSMTQDGSIVPGFVYSLNAPDKVPAFDAMDPAAVAWFLDRYRQIFLEPLAAYTSGYFFDEDCLFYANDPGHPNYRRIDYWELPAYSDAVLQAWREYCISHTVIYDGETVSKFPVHQESMVPNGGGKTQYFPGYNVPYEVESGTPLIAIPRNTGVWAAWDDFVTSQYVETWIGGISKTVWEVNRSNPDFKGVVYFGLKDWSLAYEEVVDPSFVVDDIQRWVPMGTQRGVRLSKICALPDVDHVICETFPPIRSNLYKFIAAFKRIITDYGKTFGLMIHRDDNWGLDGWDTETDRWAAIEHFQPVIIARYPIDRLFPSDPYYNEQKENLFDDRLRVYRESAVIADFSASPTSGPAPLTVQFIDRSTGTITARTWDFGDGETGASLNPTHIYRYPGTYNVVLTVTGPGGLDTKTRTDYISVTRNPDNLVLNGDFSDGTSRWNLWVESTASASGSVQNGDYVISITGGGSNTWDIQLFQMHLPIEKGKTYDVSFDAYASADRQIRSNVMMALAPWSGYGDQTVSPGSTKQTFTYTFTMNHSTDRDARLVFELGGSNTDVYLDNIVLKENTTLVQERVESGSIPASCCLLQNYPNPFNHETKIRFGLSRRSHIRISVYNMNGQQVEKLLDEDRYAGSYEIFWNAETLSSGIYMVRMESCHITQTKKMVLQR